MMGGLVFLIAEQKWLVAEALTTMQENEAAPRMLDVGLVVRSRSLMSLAAQETPVASRQADMGAPRLEGQARMARAQ